MCAVLYAIDEGFMFIGAAKAAAKIEYSVVIVQWKIAKEFLQGLKTIADLCRIGFMGFSVGLIELIQYSFAIAITRIKGMGVYVCFQPLCDLIHVGTSLPFVI